MNDERARHVLFQVLTLVNPRVQPGKLDPEGSLTEQAGLDPLDFGEVVALLSDALHAEIPKEDYPHLHTIDSAVAYLSRRMG